MSKQASAGSAARAKTESQGRRGMGREASAKELDEVRREARALKEKDNKVMTIVWVIAVVFIGIAGGAYFYYRTTTDSRANNAARYDAENAELEAKIKSFKLDTEEDAKAMLAYLSSLGKLGKRPETKDIVTGAAIKVQGKLDAFAARREYLDRLTKLETDTKGASSLTSERIEELRRDLDTLSNDQGQASVGDIPTRLGGLHSTLDKAYVLKLHSEARALPSAGPTARATLALYTRVEDIVNTLLIKSIKDKNKSLSEPLESALKEIITESDTISASVFTPEEIEKTPWQDLLRGEQATKWVKSDAPGFTYELDQTKGLLRIVGPNMESKGIGVLSIGDRDKWRDFVVEMDFEIKKGNFTMSIRTPINTARCPKVELSTDPDSNAEFKVSANSNYSIRVRAIGSKWVVESDAPEFVDAAEMPITWSEWRAGAVAFEVPIGADIVVKKMRIRALR